jgi:hypothetical protein
MTNPNLFMWIITALFAASAVRHLVDANWPQVAYAVGAVILNLSVITMGTK